MYANLYVSLKFPLIQAIFSHRVLQRLHEYTGSGNNDSPILHRLVFFLRKLSLNFGIISLRTGLHFRAARDWVFKTAKARIKWILNNWTLQTNWSKFKWPWHVGKTRFETRFSFLRKDCLRKENNLQERIFDYSIISAIPRFCLKFHKMA